MLRHCEYNLTLHHQIIMFNGQGTITHITHSESKDVVIITCQLETVFEFMEWQFMVLQTLIDGKFVKRSYSIYSTNQQLQDSKTISFCIKRKEAGVFSTWSTQVAKVGMKIDMVWPVGRFVDDKQSRNYLFISVGSGLSPCFSLYQQLLHTGNYDKIANIFGERYLNHIPSEVLDAYSVQTEKVHNQIMLSKDTMPEGKISPLWKERGWGWGKHVQDGIAEALQFFTLHSSLFTDITVFICWLPAMCDDVSQQLQTLWIPKQRLIIEKY